MGRARRTLVSVVVVVALLFAVCTVRPAPVYASSTTEIAIILGGVIGGLALIAVIMTLIVRNNPAWMPALPSGSATLKANPWEPAGTERVRFGLGCGIRDGGVPLICW